MTSFQIFHPWNLEFGTFDVKGTSVLVLISSDEVRTPKIWFLQPPGLQLNILQYVLILKVERMILCILFSTQTSKVFNMEFHL